MVGTTEREKQRDSDASALRKARKTVPVSTAEKHSQTATVEPSKPAHHPLKVPFKAKQLLSGIGGLKPQNEAFLDQPGSSLPKSSTQEITGRSDPSSQVGGANLGAIPSWYLPGSMTRPDEACMEQDPYSFAQPFMPYPAHDRLELGDPLYTAVSDGPEIRLIAQILTGTDNYTIWAREFRRALVTKDKEGLIDGSISFPTNTRLQRQWKKCSQLVRTWIENSLSKEVAGGLPPTEDAKVMWDNIKEMYGKTDRVKIFSINQSLTELRHGNLSVTSCFNRLSALWFRQSSDSKAK